MRIPCRIFLSSVLLSCALTACSGDSRSGDSATGGSSATGSGGVAGTGGSAGGGGAGSGGMTSTGGGAGGAASGGHDAGGSGGTTTAGGSIGVAGAAGTAGASGSGGATSTGGTTGAAGTGGTAGLGSASGRGGAAGNGTGGGGSAGTSGQGSLPALIVHMAGDSTMANYDSSTTQEGWGQELGQFFISKVTIDNQAQGGANIQTFYGGRWKTLINNVKAGDYVFAAFGINDSGTAHGPVSPSDFQKQMGIMADEVAAKKATFIPTTSSPLQAWSGGKETNDRLQPYCDATLASGASKSLLVDDLNARAIEYYDSDRPDRRGCPHLQRRQSPLQQGGRHLDGPAGLEGADAHQEPPCGVS